MKYLVLVRHGETEWNSDNRVQGSVDVPLSEKGKAQAAALADALAARGVRFPVAYTSDLSRARETARVVQQRLDVPRLAVDPLLREMHCGDWEGRSIDALRESEPGAYDSWMDDPAFRIPGGESVEDVRARVDRFFESRAGELESAGHVLIVAHGLLNRMILSRVMGLPPQRARYFATDNASVSLFRFTRGRVFCDGWNVGCHL
jgi:broad specificity phosphatase PhoE